MPIQFLPSPDGFEKPMNFQVRLMDLSWRTFYMHFCPQDRVQEVIKCWKSKI